MAVCIVCNKEIPQERLDVLPGTETCVDHSSVKKYIPVTQGLGMGKGYVLEFIDGDSDMGKKFEKRRKVRSWGKGVSSQDQRGSSYWKAKKRG